jgi:hypothetical protein
MPIACPRPVLFPVTMATRPSSENGMELPLVGAESQLIRTAARRAHASANSPRRTLIY